MYSSPKFPKPTIKCIKGDYGGGTIPIKVLTTPFSRPEKGIVYCRENNVREALDFYQKESEELGKEQAIWNNENYDTQGIYENFKKT